MIVVGQAGWSIRREHAEAFPGEGSHLARYARVLTGVEINSSFYRPHQPKTYARWAASVPAGFRFAVKAPRQITHFARLRDAEAPLAAAPGGAGGLAYFRWHGSPRMYHSAYGPAAVAALAARAEAAAAGGAEVWVVFDNTAAGAATGDALGLLGRI